MLWDDGMFYVFGLDEARPGQTREALHFSGKTVWGPADLDIHGRGCLFPKLRRKWGGFPIEDNFIIPT